MTFVKGHPYYPPSDTPAPLGRPRPVVRALRSLAMVIRDKLPPEEIYRWLRLVAAGIDPDAVPDPADPNGSVPAATIDMDIRLRAMKMLLERALGQPPQFVHMEADVRAQQTVQVQAVDPAAIRALPTQQLEGLRATMRALLGPPPSAPSPHAVIDLAPTPPSEPGK